MLDKINDDIKTAMKARKKEKLNALRMLKSAFIENNTSKKPRPDQDVAISHVKKLKDSLEAYPEGSDEVTNIKAEIQNLADYVPQAMSKSDVETLINEFIGSTEDANFGTVMKAISPKIKGRFDGKEATALVKSILG